MKKKLLTAILGLYTFVFGVSLGTSLQDENIIIGEEGEKYQEFINEDPKVDEDIKEDVKETEPIISFDTKKTTILATKSEIVEAIKNDEAFEDQVAESYVKEDGAFDGEKILLEREIFNAVLEEKFKESGGTLLIENGDINQAILNLLTTNI